MNHDISNVGYPHNFPSRKIYWKKILRKDEYWHNQLTKAIWRIRWPQIKQYTITTFFIHISSQKFKQSARKSLICQTISKQFAGANKKPKLNNPLREQAKTFFLHGKSKRNAHFWTCQFKNVHYILEVSL